MIKLSKSSISHHECEAVARVLNNEYLGMGKEVKEFEQELSSFFNDSFVACVSSGTAALQLALQAAGVGIGDEVLVPSLTYVASYQAISAVGATPVSCDIRLDNALIDLKDAEARISDKTKAMMPVFYAGFCGDHKSLYEFSRHHNIRVIEDAAHGFGSFYQGQKVGSIGDITCFSFDGIKNITSGEGGAVISRDRLLIDRIRDIRLLAIKKDSDQRYQGKRSWDFDVDEQGWRYHMSDIMAAIGRVQLRRFITDFSHKRRELSKYYRMRFEKVDQITIFDTTEDETVPHIFPILLNSSIERDAVRRMMEEKGIQTGIHYKPNHLLTKYKTSYSLPICEGIYKRLLTLPLHTDLSKENIDYIKDNLCECLSVLSIKELPTT